MVIRHILNIRSMVLDDIPHFLEIRNSSREFLHDNSIFSIEEATIWFQTTNPKFYIIELQQKIIGYFRTSNWIDNSVYIGADIHPEFRGKGIGYQSYCIFINYLKEKHSINRIKLEVLDTNKIAKKLYEKLGFKDMGISDNKIYRDGRYINSIIMQMEL